MAKAVLVMDCMPESCKQCVFCQGLNACKLKKYLVGDKICTVYTVDKQIMEGGKPYWCPLRELPEKKASFSDEMEKEKVSGRFDGEKGSEYANLVGKITGWNACLDEILK